MRVSRRHERMIHILNYNFFLSPPAHLHVFCLSGVLFNGGGGRGDDQ